MDREAKFKHIHLALTNPNPRHSIIVIETNKKLSDVNR
jgi:hypothetical protein